MAIISLKDVHKIYPLGKTEVHAVKGVSFDIEEGDFISIAGPSGSGKSTILNLIGCIDTPTRGTVEIEGTETGSLTDTLITSLRHQVIGFIFQSFNLIPVLSVYENIEFPLLLGRNGKRDGGAGTVGAAKDGAGGTKRGEAAERKAWIDSLIREVGLENWTRHKPNELSGGQRQRVAIARALVTKPRIVLADEPTANLDSETGSAIIELMKKMNQDFGTTFIFSTHDPAIVGIADHVIRLLDGTIIENRRQS